MNAFWIAIFSVAFAVGGCVHLDASDLKSSICELSLSALDEGARVRVKAVYSPSSMHGDVLRDMECPRERVKVYGYESAIGGLSESFERDIGSSAMEISAIEYDIDMTGMVEIDADGLWLKLLTVHEYSKRSEPGR